MRKPLSLAFALTLLAFPLACSDDDTDDGPQGGSGGASTGGSKTGGTGGKATGGTNTGGKATGGKAGTGGMGTMAGSSGGPSEGGEAGGGTTPQGGAAGAGGVPSEGGEAGGGTTPQGGAAGAGGGTAGTPGGEGGSGGAPELTQADYREAICNKEPGGSKCTGDCADGIDAIFIASCPTEESEELLNLFKCMAAQPDDDFACDGNGVIGFQNTSACETEFIAWDAWCNG